MTTGRLRAARGAALGALVLVLIFSAVATTVAESRPAAATTPVVGTGVSPPSSLAGLAARTAALTDPWSRTPTDVGAAREGPAAPATVAPQGGGFLPIVSVSTGETPYNSVYDPFNGDVYVLNAGSANVTILNNTSYVATVSLDSDPAVAVFDNSIGCVFVAGYLSYNVSEICGTAVVGVIDVGGYVSALTYDPSTYELYVADYEYDNVTLWSGNEFAGSVDVGTEPAGIAYNSATGYVYVTNYGSSNVTIITGVYKLGTLATPPHPLAPFPDPGNGYVYVVCYNDSNLTIITSISHTTTVTVGTLPEFGTYDAGTEEMYISNVGSANLSVLDGTEVVGSVNVAVTPYATAYDANNGYIYVPGGGNNEISVVNGFTLEGTVGAGLSPYAATFDSGNGYVYVTNILSNNVSVMNVPQFAVSVPPSGSNLPANSHWTLDVGGHAESVARGGSAGFDVANGTYEYFVRGPAGYDVSDLAAVGNLTVSGTTVTANGEPLSAAVFTKGPTSGTIFSRSGLPKGTPTCVVFEGTKECIDKGSVSVTNLTPATYQYTIPPLPGYTESVKVDGVAAPTSGWLTLTEKHATINVKYTVVTYALSFTESGLASGKSWTVKVKGEVNGHVKTESRSSKTDSISFTLPNGTYSYTVEHVKGYGWAGNGSATLAGGSVGVAVTFVADPPASLPIRSDPPLSVGAQVVLDPRSARSISK